MKKIFNLLLIVVLLIGSVVMLSGCEKKTETKKIKVVSNIKLNKEQYIKQLIPVKINGTDDTLTITSEVKWKVPEEADGNTTVSFSIAIPYTIKVDGVEYKGIYQLNSEGMSTLDNNPKYEFKVVNLTKNGDISVHLSLKK